ncbi:immunodominant staphylococcal antigen IsaB family protein [Staphylococcus sp. AS1337]|uniref:immunodominant staphylococcal antigen IsaB family protein n=1 Tax=Staphylococcus sp. AS1337 TaxID=3434042 RepID=UPI003F556B2B
MSHNEVQADTTQAWYAYNGCISKAGDFVLDQSVYNGLKSGNINFNGIKVNSKYSSKTISKKIYDQVFQQIDGK